MARKRNEPNVVSRTVTRTEKIEVQLSQGQVQTAIADYLKARFDVVVDHPSNIQFRLDESGCGCDHSPTVVGAEYIHEVSEVEGE